MRVLEFFSPPPATGASSAYSKTVPYLEAPLHANDDILGNWPMGRAAIEDKDSLQLIQDRDLRWRSEGDLQVGLMCSTEHLTVAVMHLLPGDASGARSHAGDALMHVTAGELHVHTPEAEAGTWWRVREGESIVIPDGVAYRLVNQSAHPVSLISGSAPGYLQ